VGQQRHNSSPSRLRSDSSDRGGLRGGSAQAEARPGRDEPPSRREATLGDGPDITGGPPPETPAGGECSVGASDATRDESGSVRHGHVADRAGVATSVEAVGAGTTPRRGWSPRRGRAATPTRASPVARAARPWHDWRGRHLWAGTGRALVLTGVVSGCHGSRSQKRLGAGCVQGGRPRLGHFPQNNPDFTVNLSTIMGIGSCVRRTHRRDSADAIRRWSSRPTTPGSSRAWG
jgi:hypothetical protein